MVTRFLICTNKENNIKFRIELDDGVSSLDSPLCFLSYIRGKEFFIPAKFTENNIRTVYPLNGWIIDSYEDNTYSKVAERMDYSFYKT